MFKYSYELKSPFCGVLSFFSSLKVKFVKQWLYFDVKICWESNSLISKIVNLLIGFKMS